MGAAIQKYEVKAPFPEENSTQEGIIVWCDCDLEPPGVGLGFWGTRKMTLGGTL